MDPRNSEALTRVLEAESSEGVITLLAPGHYLAVLERPLNSMAYGRGRPSMETCPRTKRERTVERAAQRVR